MKRFLWDQEVGGPELSESRSPTRDDGTTIPAEGVEMQRPRLPGKVPEPSLTEMDEHESSGLAVYRTWCKHCVAAKGRGNPHLADGEEGEVAEVAFDYGYMSRDSVKCLPMICGRDRQTQSHAASFVKSNGRDPYAIAYVTSSWSWIQTSCVQERQ